MADGHASLEELRCITSAALRLRWRPARRALAGLHTKTAGLYSFILFELELGSRKLNFEVTRLRPTILARIRRDHAAKHNMNYHLRYRYSVFSSNTHAAHTSR